MCDICYGIYSNCPVCSEDVEEPEELNEDDDEMSFEERQEYIYSIHKAHKEKYGSR